MSGEGESDDSTTIRRKILLSPTMPPRDSLDLSGSPLANLIGQVCLGHFAPLLVHNAVLDSVLNGMLACDQKLVTSRSIPISLRCSHSPVFWSQQRADIVSSSNWQLLALQKIPGMDTFHTSIRITDPSIKSHLHGYWTARMFSLHRPLSNPFPLKALKIFSILPRLAPHIH